MKRLALALFLLPAMGCQETPISLPLRSLERSGEVSFVCVSSADGAGQDINSCPDFDSKENARHLLALVTQTLRGEVAVVDLSAGRVVDIDRSTPGYNFLPVGENPVDIVSTPGGVASFVGVAEVGKEGIFAIPSSCARPPAHDLTSWPACALPAAPGEMAIAIDPPAEDDDGDPSTPAPVRASCDAGPTADAALPGTALAATRADCPADLALETAPPGRRKLLVTLPTLGMIAVIDAQSLLDREPGSFQPCDARYIGLEVALPSGDIEQKVPDDLVSACTPAQEINYGPQPGEYEPWPAGLELSGNLLYVADRGAPVVHVLDVSDPCSPFQVPPLLPRSYESPNRVVTTLQVAVGPPTSQGRRFAYAVDDFDGSVMIFEVTPGHSDRTPIVRPGSPRLPFEPPDRIAFSAPARDVTFALRDAPAADPETGVATIGTYCDPDPNIPADSSAALYRTNGDYSRGARPRNLRGVFGFVMLSSGQVAVIDVEDFDAPCRRPVNTNSAPTEDFRGCLGDPESIPFFTSDQTAQGKRTVSGELSCRVVEPHRVRSGRVMINGSEFGLNAPALRGFPSLSSAEAGALATDRRQEALKNPRLLAVDFPNPKGGSLPAQVFVGTTFYQSATGAATTPANLLPTDPAEADRASLALVLSEPRAFGGDEDMTLAYEGAFIRDRKAGFPQLAVLDEKGNLVNRLVDHDGGFCDRGVEDEVLARARAASLGVAPADQDAFARRHADYLQITSPLPDKDDGYWSNATCGGSSGKQAYFACRDVFGPSDEPAVRRDFRILRAFQDKLEIEPRSYGSDDERAEIIGLVHCCFRQGAAISYQVRAGHQWVLTGSGSGFRHHVRAGEADEGFPCEDDCSPRKSHLVSRAFEISARDCDPKAGDCAVGPATEEDVACVMNETAPVTPGSALDKCVFQSLTHRFAVYRGNQPTARDTAFGWSVAGSFVPLAANLASQSRAVSPQSVVFVPQINQLAVADGASEGLVLVSLDSVGVSRLFF